MYITIFKFLIKNIVYYFVAHGLSYCISLTEHNGMDLFSKYVYLLESKYLNSR